MKNKILLDKFVDLFNNIKLFKPLINLYYKYRQIWLYLFFGTITTLINILVYQALINFNIDYLFSNIIAWVISVFIAFIFNIKYIFENVENKMIREFINFYFSRVFTLIIDMILMYIGVSLLLLDSLLVKIVVNILIIGINYVIAKFIIFKKSNKKDCM